MCAKGDLFSLIVLGTQWALLRWKFMLFCYFLVLFNSDLLFSLFSLSLTMNQIWSWEKFSTLLVFSPTPTPLSLFFVFCFYFLRDFLNFIFQHILSSFQNFRGFFFFFFWSEFFLFLYILLSTLYPPFLYPSFFYFSPFSLSYTHWSCFGDPISSLTALILIIVYVGLLFIFHFLVIASPSIEFLSSLCMFGS